MNTTAHFGNYEVRRRMRLSHNAQVEMIHQEYGIVWGQLRDISQFGLYFYALRMELPVPPPGSLVAVRLQLGSEKNRLVVDVEATVARIDGRGIALSFPLPLQWLPVFTVFPGGQPVATHSDSSQSVVPLSPLQ